MRVRNLAKRTRTNAHVRVRVRSEFWQNAHVRAMCVRPKFECANVRACEANNRRNSQLEFIDFHTRKVQAVKDAIIVIIVVNVNLNAIIIGIKRNI